MHAEQPTNGPEPQWQGIMKINAPPLTLAECEQMENNVAEPL